MKKIPDLRRYADRWVLDCKYRQLSPRTVDTLQETTDKLLWFLTTQGYERADTLAIRSFVGYVGTGHADPGRRWGNPLMTKPVRPRVVRDYFINVRTFFRWMATEGYIDADPMANLKPPVSRPDQMRHSNTAYYLMLSA